MLDMRCCPLETTKPLVSRNATEKLVILPDIDHTSSRVGYRKLENRARRLRCQLHALGDPCAICMEHQNETMIGAPPVEITGGTRNTGFHCDSPESNTPKMLSLRWEGNTKVRGMVRHGQPLTLRSRPDHAHNFSGMAIRLLTADPRIRFTEIESRTPAAKS